MGSLKKDIVIPVLLAVAIVLIVSLPASAAISGFVARADNGELYQYGYSDLLDSYALTVLGLSNGLYEDFAKKKTYALFVENGAYIDYKDVLDHYASALILRQDFNLLEYLESDKTKKASMPESLLVAYLDEDRFYFVKSNPASHGAETDSSTSEKKKPDTSIVGLSVYSLEQAQQWARDREAHQRYIDVAPLYWEYGQLTGIRPEVLYAQAGVETNLGNYSNIVPPLFNNWAGIKRADAEGDSTQDHETFSDVEEGVRAHYNHMAAYVGIEPLGEPHGRYYVVIDQPWAGSIKQVEDLSGKWAPKDNYHLYILNILEQIAKTEIENGKENEPGPAEGNGWLPGQEVAVSVNVLHLRSGPGTEYDILNRLYLGTPLHVSGNQAEWLKVIAPGNKNGWVHGDYVKNINLSGESLPGKIIVLDPGHGGSDKGAVGPSGLQEKEVTLAIALYLAELLEEAGVEVIMTRSRDYSVTNIHRVETANRTNADLFISIHSNAYSNPNSNGIETHYSSENGFITASRYLAYQLQSELVAALGLRDRGVKDNRFYVVRNVEMPAALVEIAFITNNNEEALLKSEEVQKKAAKSLLRGIERYLLQF